MLVILMRKITIFLIQLYRICLSPFLGDCCRFYPSCSLYAKIAVEKQGLGRGAWLVMKRILKCHPWYRGDCYDPVPEKFS